MKSILITGAAGFVGQHLIQRISRDKSCRIHSTYLKKCPSIYHRITKWRQLDITNKFQVENILKSLKPDAIMHLAAQSIPRLSWQLSDLTLRINTVGTLNLLDAMRQFTPKSRLLFVSTNLVYGRSFRSNLPVDEQSLCNPENPYAMSKHLAELACLDFASRFNLDIVIARPFNHMGRGQSQSFVFSEWCRQIAVAEKGKQKPILNVGNIDASRDFSHVDDIVEGYLTLLRKGKTGEIYNLCSEKNHLLSDHVHYLFKMAKVKMRYQVKKDRLRTDDPKIMSGTCQKIKALGWSPRRTVFDALSEMLNEQRELA